MASHKMPARILTPLYGITVPKKSTQGEELFLLHFNDGAVFLVDVLKILGVVNGPHTLQWVISEGIKN